MDPKEKQKQFQVLILLFDFDCICDNNDIEGLWVSTCLQSLRAKMVVVGDMNFKRVFFFFKHFIKFEWEIHYVRCS